MGLPKLVALLEGVGKRMLKLWQSHRHECHHLIMHLQLKNGLQQKDQGMGGRQSLQDNTLNAFLKKLPQVRLQLCPHLLLFIVSQDRQYDTSDSGARY
jgi:hypothetical protein